MNIFYDCETSIITMKMRKILICVCCLFMTNHVVSQNKNSIKYFNHDIFCTSFGFGNYITRHFNGYEYSVRNSEITFGVSTINGIQIQNHQVGIGVGFDKWEEAFLVPVFLNYTFNFTKKSISPYGLFNIGYSFGQKNETQYDDVEQGSFFLKCGFGVQIKITERLSLTAEVAYKLQNMRSSYQRVINNFEAPQNIKYNIHYNFIVVSIGTKF